MARTVRKTPPTKFTGPDYRRVLTAFGEAVPPPFVPIVTLSDDGKRLNVVVKNPRNEALTVVEATFLHSTVLRGPQPTDDELAKVAAGFANCCESYGTR